MRLSRYLHSLWVLLLISLPAFGGLQKVKERGSLKIGVEPGFLPFEMRTPQDVWVGFDVDMMNAFCKKIAVRCEFISSKWDGIIPGLVAGKYDVIVSGMTITPDRAKTVLFGDPYYDAGLRVMLTKASKVKSPGELDQADKVIAVKLGTTGDIYASKTFKKAQIRRLDAEADAAQAVALGRAEAFIYDQPYINLFAASQGDKVRVLPDSLSKEQFGVATVKKNEDLIAAFNAFLKDWRASGAYQKSYKDNFEDLLWKKQFPQSF